MLKKSFLDTSPYTGSSVFMEHAPSCHQLLSPNLQCMERMLLDNYRGKSANILH